MRRVLPVLLLLSTLTLTACGSAIVVKQADPSSAIDAPGGTSVQSVNEACARTQETLAQAGVPSTDPATFEELQMLVDFIVTVVETDTAALDKEREGNPSPELDAALAEMITAEREMLPHASAATAAIDAQDAVAAQRSFEEIVVLGERYDAAAQAAGLTVCSSDGE